MNLTRLARSAQDKFSAFPPVTPREKRAVAGVLHALKPTSMRAEFAPRTLVEFTPQPDGAAPHTAIAVGDIDGDLEGDNDAFVDVVTWQINGIYYHSDTVAWGAAEEAAKLQWAQRQAGARNPLVISWLGYDPPGLLGGLSNTAAKSGGRRLAEHLQRVFSSSVTAEVQRPAPDTHVPRLAIDAHSYGGVTAMYGLADYGLLRETSRVNFPRLDALLVSGGTGIPKELDRDQLPVDAISFHRARGDIKSALSTGLGVLTGSRRSAPLADVSQYPGITNRGHETHGGAGYRDVGTRGMDWLVAQTLGHLRRA